MNTPSSDSKSNIVFSNSMNDSHSKSAGFWQQALDSIALVLAGTCAFHCLLLPLFVVFFPLLGKSVVNDPQFHFWMLFAVIPTTAIAVFLGCRKHKDKWVVGLSSAGLLLLILGVLIELSHHGHHHGHSHDHTEGISFGLENGISIIGGILMASAHIRNFRNCRSQNSDCHCEH
ncbi:MerC domain-containing protein [Puniceicoccaceae bacterium K14]|nr:MerC domain-containing protein [Puniceicoccaceae bacterium K14]